MTDIVERLRQVNPWMSFSVPDPERVEAADEIERLRAALEQLASMAESGTRAYDDNELRDLLIEIDNHARRALEPKP